jgi:hypothetical protein
MLLQACTCLTCMYVNTCMYILPTCRGLRRWMRAPQLWERCRDTGRAETLTTARSPEKEFMILFQLSVKENFKQITKLRMSELKPEMLFSSQLIIIWKLLPVHLYIWLSLPTYVSTFVQKKITANPQKHINQAVY